MYMPTGTRGDKWYGAFFALMALGMAGWAAYTAVQSASSHQWPAVPCAIQTSRVSQVGGENPYLFEVLYRYQVQGRPFVASTYREDYRGSWDVAHAERLLSAYPAGQNRRCFVNPSEPTQAILEHDPLWIPIVLALVALLGGVFLAKVFLLPARPSAEPDRGTWGLSGLLLLVTGLGGYVYFFGLPLWAEIRSLRWVPTPCVVESAQVRSIRHDGQVPVIVYWPDIVYGYQINGLRYRANLYNASDVGSPWWAYGARNTIRSYPIGRRTTCYVNPADPFETVLDRTPSSTQWFGLWPLIMAILGAAGILQTLIGREIHVRSSPSWSTLALGMATGFAILILIETGDDLLIDLKARRAEPMESLVVAIAALVSAWLLVAWIRLTWKQNTRASSEAVPTDFLVED